MMWVMGIWGIGFILSALAFYHKDMRGKYVSGNDLIVKLIICTIPALNFIFGVAYFLAEFVGWCGREFQNRCGRLVWNRDHFKWIVNKETNDE
jgi:hypothetical protein